MIRLENGLDRQNEKYISILLSLLQVYNTSVCVSVGK